METKLLKRDPRGLPFEPGFGRKQNVPQLPSRYQIPKHTSRKTRPGCHFIRLGCDVVPKKVSTGASPLGRSHPADPRPWGSSSSCTEFYLIAFLPFSVFFTLLLCHLEALETQGECHSQGELIPPDIKHPVSAPPVPTSRSAVCPSQPPHSRGSPRAPVHLPSTPWSHRTASTAQSPLSAFELARPNRLPRLTRASLRKPQ